MANAAGGSPSRHQSFSGEVPKTIDEIAKAAADTAGYNTSPRRSQVSPAAAAPAPVDTAFNVLFGYIPTEVLTLYVAVLAVVQQKGTAGNPD